MQPPRASEVRREPRRNQIVEDWSLSRSRGTVNSMDVAGGPNHASEMAIMPAAEKDSRSIGSDYWGTFPHHAAANALAGWPPFFGKIGPGEGKLPLTDRTRLLDDEAMRGLPPAMPGVISMCWSRSRSHVARRIGSYGSQRRRQKQLQWVIHDRLEAVLTVKVGCGFVLGMHEQEF